MRPFGGSASSSSEAVRLACLTASFVALAVVGTTAPNAAQPGLGEPGWAPGPLVAVALGPAAVTGVLWAAYAVGAVAVWAGLRTGTAPLRSWRVPLGVGAAVLLAAPFGSADHVNYLAYGRILVGGGDPWVEAPAEWGGGIDPVASRVEAPWTEEPSVYGPVATLVFAGSALVGGDSLRQGIWVWQVVVVGCWLGTRWLLRRALPAETHGRVDVLWTLNPLVVGVGVLGAHVDALATVLVVAALVAAARAGPTGPATPAGWAASERRSRAVGARAALSVKGFRTEGGLVEAAVAGVLAACAASAKVTYGVVLVGVAAAWWLGGRRGRALVAPVVVLLGAAAVTTVALHVWAGPHVYDQLLRSRQAVSLATPWRPVLEWLRDQVGNGPARVMVSVVAAGLAVVLAWCLLRRTRPVDPVAPVGDADRPGAAAGPAMWVTGCLALAYALAAPYSLPWYDVLVWALLPAVRPGAVDRVALVRLGALAVAYVPGRVVGMTPAVEEVTLGVRRGVVPWVGLALWVVVIALGARSGPPSGPSGWWPRR